MYSIRLASNYSAIFSMRLHIAYRYTGGQSKKGKSMTNRIFRIINQWWPCRPFFLTFRFLTFFSDKNTSHTGARLNFWSINWIWICEFLPFWSQILEIYPRKLKNFHFLFYSFVSNSWFFSFKSLSRSSTQTSKVTKRRWQNQWIQNDFENERTKQHHRLFCSDFSYAHFLTSQKTVRDSINFYF